MAFPMPTGNNARDKAMVAKEKGKKPPVGKRMKGKGAKGMMAKMGVC